jgi:hypothetical protein
MDYQEHECAGCKEMHGASLWYYRQLIDTGRREYLCGEEFNALNWQDKVGWLRLEPRDPDAGN